MYLYCIGMQCRNCYLLVRPVTINTVTVVTAWICLALVHIQFTIRSIKAVVAFTSIRVAGSFANTIRAARIVSTVVNLLAMVSGPTKGTSTRIIGKRLKATRSPILTRTIGARIVGDGDFTKRGLISNWAGTFEGGASCRIHDYRTGASILTLLSASVTWIFILTVFARESRWTAKGGKNGNESICSNQGFLRFQRFQCQY